MVLTIFENISLLFIDFIIAFRTNHLDLKWPKRRVIRLKGTFRDVIRWGHVPFSANSVHEKRLISI